MTSYHHGTVREAALEAAHEIISHNGPSALSLRALAQRVGVTTPALYRHFAGLDDIVADVACTVAEEFGRELGQCVDETELAHRYLGWAQREPHLYRLLFSQRGLGSATAAERFPDGPPPQRAFMAICGSTDRALGLWVTAHGVADLAIAGLLDPASVSAEEAIALALSVREVGPATG